MEGCTWYNCGCAIRRRSDEREQQPVVGLLYDTGEVEPYILKSEIDAGGWSIKVGEVVRSTSSPEDELCLLVDDMKDLKLEVMDFEGELRKRVCQPGVGSDVKRLIEEVLQEVRDER